MTAPPPSNVVAVARQPGGDGRAAAQLARVFHDRIPLLVGETARTLFSNCPRSIWQSRRRTLI